MFRRGNLVTFWRPFVVALIVLLALVLWLGSSDTQVLIHKLKSKMRGELPSWILGCLCMIWWKWKIPGVKMRRLCRPGWSSLGNRGFASRGSADLPLLGVGLKSEQFPLYFASFLLWGCSLFEGDRTFAGSSPATSRNHGYWGCQQGWHWLLNADTDVNGADRVNHCQKQTWTWPLNICHVPSRSPRNTSMERTWCSSQRWELLLLSKQLAYIGGSLLGQLGFWLFSISSWEESLCSGYSCWLGQARGVCLSGMASPLCFNHNPPPPSFMVITCTISMFICNTATCAMMCPILKVRSTLLWSSSTRLPGGAGAGVLEGLEAKRGLRQWRGMLWWQGPHSQAEVRAS